MPLTRADVERTPSHLLSPTAKLVVEWLSRQPARAYTAKEVGIGLGMLHAEVAQCAPELRMRKLVEGGFRPYGEMELTAEARAAYAPAPAPIENPKKKDSK